jgi:hypothetical protein
MSGGRFVCPPIVSLLMVASGAHAVPADAPLRNSQWLSS